MAFIAGHALLGTVVLVAPAAQRLAAAGFAALLLVGWLGVSWTPRRAAVDAVWSGVVACVLVAVPPWLGPDAPLWLLALPMVVLPTTRSSTASLLLTLGLAGAAAAGLTAAGADAGLAGAALAGAGLLAAVGQRRQESRDGALARCERELLVVRAELRDLQGRLVTDSEDRIVALTRANQALQAELAGDRSLVEAAIDARRTKATFLSTISHELRTPLNAIVGYTDLLLEHAEESGQADLRTDLARIQTSGQELLALIDDVLDLARIEAGKFEVHLEEFMLGELLREAIDAVVPLAERAGDTLKLRVPRELGTIRSDRSRLRQILVQLLGNACKFTERGLIELHAEPTATPQGRAYALTVRDTGVGIDPTYLPRIFTPFSQADDSPRRRVGGLGIGLALCRHYCTLLGGEISVHSEPGKGSAFRVVVPAHSRDPREAGITIVSAF